MASSPSTELVTLDRFTELFDREAQLDLAELDASIAATIEARFAENTQRSYRYWVGRLRLWLADPATRWRGRTAPAFPDAVLFPITPTVESVIARWVTDMVEGPKPSDTVAREDWEDDGGPMAPTTFRAILAAIAAEAETANHLWVQSAGFVRWRKGMTARLAAQHEVVKARPLRVAELRTICECLLGRVSLDRLRDEAVLELSAEGVGPAAIAKLTRESGMWSSQAPSDSRRSAQHEASLLVDGSTRVIHGRTAAALRELAQQTTGDPDAALVPLTSSNPRAHVRKILLRLARLAGLGHWQPRDGLDAATLQAMRRVLGSGVVGAGEAKALRDRALLLIGWAAALRRSELAALRIGDITFVEDGLRVLVRFSKTDRLGEGTLLGITAGAHPATDARAAVAEWIGILTRAGFTRDDPLWPSLDRHGNPKGGRLTGHQIQEILRDRAVEAGVVMEEERSLYRGHSLRRGFMTSAAEAGLPALEIQRHSRHKSLAMVAAYTDEARLVSRSVTSMLGL